MLEERVSIYKYTLVTDSESERVNLERTIRDRLRNVNEVYRDSFRMWEQRKCSSCTEVPISIRGSSRQFRIKRLENVLTYQ